MWIVAALGLVIADRGENVPDHGVWVYGDCRLRALMLALSGEGGIVLRAELGPGLMNWEGGMMMRGLSGRERAVRGESCGGYEVVFGMDVVELEEDDEVVEIEVVESDDV